MAAVTSRGGLQQGAVRPGEVLDLVSQGVRVQGIPSVRAAQGVATFHAVQERLSVT